MAWFSLATSFLLTVEESASGSFFEIAEDPAVTLGLMSTYNCLSNCTNPCPFTGHVIMKRGNYKRISFEAPFKPSEIVFLFFESKKWYCVL